MEDSVLFSGARGQFGALSNFFPLAKPLEHEGVQYATSEHLYQALKYSCPGASTDSKEYAKAIAAQRTPYGAKLLGRKIPRGRHAQPEEDTHRRHVIQQFKGAVIRSDWEQVKETIMLYCLRLKFTTDEHCREVLMSTGNRPLVEHSPWDRYWGDGGDGTGENRLGRLLVQVRAEFFSHK